MLNISPEFVLGGNATFTVDNGKGEHYTFKVRQPKPEMPFFANLLTGPDNEESFTYMGMVVVGDLKLTAKSAFPCDSKPVKVLRWALGVVWGQNTLPEGYNVQHAGKCGCCGRKLTHPESLATGIGPECAKRKG